MKLIDIFDVDTSKKGGKKLFKKILNKYNLGNNYKEIAKKKNIVNKEYIYIELTYSAQVRVPPTAGLEELIWHNAILMEYKRTNENYIFNVASKPVALKYLKGIYEVDGVTYDHSSYEKLVQSFIKRNIAESEIIQIDAEKFNNIDNFLNWHKQ